MSRFFIEQSDAGGNVFTNTGDPKRPYQVFKATVNDLDKQTLIIQEPEWMREQQSQGFGWANTILKTYEVWEVEGPVRTLTPREYMQLAIKERPYGVQWTGAMTYLYEQVSKEQS